MFMIFHVCARYLLLLLTLVWESYHILVVGCCCSFSFCCLNARAAKCAFFSCLRWTNLMMTCNNFSYALSANPFLFFIYGLTVEIHLRERNVYFLIPSESNVSWHILLTRTRFTILIMSTNFNSFISLVLFAIEWLPFTEHRTVKPKVCR